MNRAVRGIRQQISAIAAGVTAVVIALVLFAQLAVSLQSNLHKVTDQSAVLARASGRQRGSRYCFSRPRCGDRDIGNPCAITAGVIGRH